jgi:HlyD family secretion protein
MKKWLVIAGVLILALAVSGYFMFVKKSATKYSFRFDKVSKGDLIVLVTATGTINPVTSVDVGTQVSGIVAKLYADFNSVVKQGQVIAQIDSTFLVQSVKDAEASLDRAVAQEAESARNLAREKELLAKGLDTQANYDAALTAFETNKATTKSARANLDRARINLAYSTIHAPISGVVINRAVNVGQTVAASFSSPTLYSIANDLSKMQVLATVDESDIGRISMGQEATFTVDSYPDESFKGTVSQIRLAPVTIQNVVNYTVVIDVNNDQLRLMPGMTASVKVRVADAKDVLRIPNMALRLQPPADLIDTTKVKGMREGFSGRMRQGGEGRGDWPGGNEGGGPNMEEGRNRFRALRDSITAAHGGHISDEDLSTEMRKVVAAFRPPDEPAPKRAAAQIVKPPKSAKFGIDLRFPEYEKSPYVPQHQSGRARIWIQNSSGKLEPVMVRTGITDGKFTEINSRSLKEGDQIVLGVTTNGEAAQTSSPFTQGGGSQRMGGGPPGGFR